MKRALILCLFLFMAEVPVFCDPTVFPPLRPMSDANGINNYTSNNITSVPDQFTTPVNTNYTDITKIEQTLFGQTYENQNISIRLSRIEKNLFSKTYQNSNPTQRIDNIISNYKQINTYPNISKNVLSKIERQVFNQSFDKSNPKLRIERLESQLLGAVQSGDLDARYETIKLAAKAYNKNKGDFSDMDTNTGWKGLSSTFGNSMFGGGTMTGFTPPISPVYSGYNNGYGGGGLLNRGHFSNVILGSGNSGSSLLGSPNRFGHGYSNPYMRAYGNPYTAQYANPYTNPYSNPYTATPYQSGRYGANPRTGNTRGYYNGTSDYGSGASVTILD